MGFLFPKKYSSGWRKSFLNPSPLLPLLHQILICTYTVQRASFLANVFLFLLPCAVLCTLSYAVLKWRHQNTLMLCWGCFSFSCHVNTFLSRSIFILSRSSVRWWQCKAERCLDRRKSQDAIEGRKGIISSFSWDLPVLMAICQLESLNKTGRFAESHS